MGEREKEAAWKAWKALDDKFGDDIIILGIHRISTIADCFIIAGGSNPNQIRAMAAEVQEKLQGIGFPMHHIEGLGAANWVLLDYGSIIIHIFDKESRGFYGLERLWNDAYRIEADELQPMHA
jgi:ribosome-associated protein